MNKQWEPERSRIEHADDARITLTIALHGKQAWEMLLEDSHRYHSIGHGWATENPQDWEDAIVLLLRRLFVSGRLGVATKVPMYDASECTPASTNVAMYDPPSVAPQHALNPISAPAGRILTEKRRDCAELKVFGRLR